MKQYTQKELEEFTKGFKKAADIISMEKPDHILAPVIGAVPFVDVLSIVNRHFPLEIVSYPPNSSRFANRDELMRKWDINFLRENYANEGLKIMTIDEVISGSSAVKGYIQFRRAIEDLARERSKGLENEIEALKHYTRKLGKKISYQILGITENRGKRITHSFSRLMNKKIARRINFSKIFTMDNVDLNTVRLKVGPINAQGRQNYLPEIERFEISSEYLEFLQDIARCVGADPKNVNPVNLGKIKESLSEYLK
ncbi:hypothetical protein COV15_01655 [Candidatus Woesearchaeota archaeon CG10_big_fil_rev_8_21_14_0_10_34_12]|nr:MAG: hypothetical protein COV15_01655 [Candidatus Woesearchaeota archaeon CG10_big_fil_rev_8_21_14_0_10_34_12]